MVLALAAAVLAVSGAAGHGGHPQKKLFNERWHYQPMGDYDAWMTLATSDVQLLCDATEQQCGNKWWDPFDGSMTDWNSQPTTVLFDYTEGVVLPNSDVDVVVFDQIPGEPDLLGLGPTFDINGDPCGSGCVVYYGLAAIGDDAHSGLYATLEERQGTIAHEVGHLIQLAHESVNADESVLYDCGMDDTGPIPYSIMSYHCIDPPPFGLGIFEVQPWDACGVNHAYFDPGFGYAGCGDTPTPTPTDTPQPTPTSTPEPSPTDTPQPTPTGTGSATPTDTPGPGTERTWGDVDCDGGTSTRDNQGLLRRVLQQNPLSQTEPCPDLGTSQHVAGIGNKLWGDLDCDGQISTRDNQALLRRVLQQNPLSQTEPCPDIGSMVTVN
jgi:hypothetical protein